jgi:ferredoxin
MRCPGKAIQAQRVWYRGVEKNKLIHGRCRPVMTRFSGCGICIKVCPVQKYGMDEVMEHYLETGEILGKGTENLEGYDLPGNGYFPAGKTPSFNREFFDMPTGTESETALSELNEALDRHADLSDIEKEEIWQHFQNRFIRDREKKTRIIDMGMDMDL